MHYHTWLACGAGDLNSGPHAYVADTLLIEPSNPGSTLYGGYFPKSLTVFEKPSEDGVMAPRLRPVAALPEVLSSVPSNHMVTHNHL